MKYYSTYGNCQALALAMFLDNNPAFKEEYQRVFLPACHLIAEEEIDRFVREKAGTIDLFIYIPISDDYRGNYKFSSTHLLSHLRPDCITISFPSLFYNVYDRQITYLSDLNNNRISVPYEYHDKYLVRAFIEHHRLPDEEIVKRYFDYISNPRNFSRKELLEAAESSYRELRRREDLMEESGKNDCTIRVSDFINDNFRDRRLFYSCNHPARHLYLFIRERLFDCLGIDPSRPDLDPGLDPQTEFIFGLLPWVKAHLELRFEDDTPLPSNLVTFQRYLALYRDLDMEILMKAGEYPEKGRFMFGEGWRQDEAGQWWAGSPGAVILVSSDSELPEEHHLFFTVFAVAPIRIRVFVNDSFTRAIEFKGEERFSFVHLGVILDRGENRVVFSPDQDLSGEGGRGEIPFGVVKFAVYREAEISPGKRRIL